MWRLLLFELIIVLLVAAIWVFGPLVGLESVGARIGLIAVLLLPPLVLAVVKLIQRLKSSKGLETALKAQSQPEEVAPDRADEIAALKAQFDEAIGALKASKLGKGSPLYALPWYMIIGPPGAGKSTALLRSGLNFPFTTGDKSIKGVGGTRNCDWWFSDEAILLDTAGRYTLEEEDQQEWGAFLGMLRRHRPKRPLNGLIVCISIGELLANTPEENQAIAAQVRKRIDELLTSLELTIPVYLIFSKCDLVAGFVESFGEMKRAPRGQVLGFTIPLSTAKTNIGQRFQEEFTLLLENLRKRALAQIAVCDFHSRAGVYTFPMQLDAGRETLLSFIEPIFAPDPYRETPQLRGIYFCSGTQEGQPIDQLSSIPASTVGAAGAEKPGKSFFLRDVFTKVIFPDQNVATTSKRGLTRRLRADLLSVVAGVAVAAVVLGISLVSYSNNSSLISTSVDLAKVSQVSRSDDPVKVVESLRHLSKLAKRYDVLTRYNDSAPLSYGFGYYSGKPLAEPIRRVFAKRMRGAFVSPVASELEANLGDVSGAKSDVINDYQLLKTYLMVISPKRLDVREATPLLVELWKKRLNPRVAKETDLLTGLAQSYLQLLKAGHARWSSKDQDLVDDVRKTLRQRDVDYRRLVADAAQSMSPLTLRDILRGRIQPAVSAKQSVPGIYTRAGWKLHMAKRLEKKAVEPWVLGETESVKKLSQRLKRRYFEEYTRSWRAFIQGLSLRRTKDVKDAEKLLKVLTDEPPIYRTLFTAIRYQTRFPSIAGKAAKASKALGAKIKKALSLGKKAGGKLPAKDLNPVERYFLPLAELVQPSPGPDGKAQVAGLKQYLDQLTAVRDAMTAFNANTDQPDPVPLNKALGDARRVAAGVLSPLPPSMRSLMSPLFFQPLMGAANQAVEARAAITGSSFSTEVCESFNEKLRGRYPFANSSRDAHLQDAVDFFSPGGTAWAFFNASLKGQLKRKGDSFVAVSGVKVPSNVLSFYRRAWLVSRALFARGSDKPKIRFEVRPQPAIMDIGAGYAVSQITLEVGDQKKTYRNGPLEIWNYEWPRGANMARLVVRGGGGLREELSARGDWALMRLIDRAKVRRKGAWYQVIWPFKGGKLKIRIDVRPSRTHNPLFRRLSIHCR